MGKITMPIELLLSFKYIKAHRHQSISLVLTCALFMTAFISTLICRDSFLATSANDFDLKYGTHKGVIYNADPTRIELYKTEIESSGSGLVRVMGEVKADTKIEGVWFGSMDFAAIQLRRLELKDGRYAENPDEIAVESTVLRVLFPGAKCGDKLEISMSRNGELSNKTYILVGIVEDYITSWQSTDGSKISIKYPPPAILTIDNDVPAVYTHILCNDNALGTVLGGEFVENFHDHLDPELTYQKNVVNIVVIAIISYIAIIMVVGLIGNIGCVMKDHEQYLILLRCIGMKKRQGISLFFVQAMMLLFASSVIGLLLSVGLSMMIIAIFSAFGKQLILVFNYSCFWLALILSTVAICGAFVIAAIWFFRKMPLDTSKNEAHIPQVREQKIRSLKKLWLRASDNQNHFQNVVIVLLIAACFFITMFGGFIATFSPWEIYGDVDLVETDYSLFVPSGTQNAEQFYITTPRPMGVSLEDFKLLCSTEGVGVRSAVVNHMTSHFVLYSQDSKTPFFEKLIAEENVLLERDIPYLTNVIVELGGSEGDLLVALPLIGLNYDSLVKMVNITDGKVDRDAFVTGDMIIAPDSFSIGDSFLLVTPLFSDKAISQNDIDRYTFHSKLVTVAAVYPSAEGSHFYYSAEAIMSVDDTARFEQIDLINLVPHDEAASARIETVLDQIVARSTYTSINNFIDRRQEYVREIRNGQILIIMIVLIFVGMVIFAITGSISVKIRVNLHDYLLIRAIGGKKNIVEGLIRSEVICLIVTGGLIGVVAGGSLPVVMMIQTYTYLNVAFVRAFVWPCLTSLLVFLVLLSLGFLAIRKPIQELFYKDVASTLSSVEL